MAETEDCCCAMSGRHKTRSPEEIRALTNRLNGEDESSAAPAFRRFGLRVRSADILSVDFYSDRR